MQHIDFNKVPNIYFIISPDPEVPPTEPFTSEEFYKVKRIIDTTGAYNLINDKIMNEVLTPEKMKELKELTGLDNHPPSWAYVLQHAVTGNSVLTYNLVPPTTTEKSSDE